MKTQHTPGPWIGKNGSGGQGVIHSEATGANVAVSYDHRDTALIASAPSLLGALMSIAESARTAKKFAHGQSRYDLNNIEAMALDAIAQANPTP
jgi:hypothetical protein